MTRDAGICSRTRSLHRDSAYAFRPYVPCRRTGVSLRTVRHLARLRRRRRTRASAKAFRSTTENRGRHRRNRRADIAFRSGSRRPARFAIYSADFPTIAGIQRSLRREQNFCDGFGFRLDSEMSALCLNCSRTSASSGASTTTDCSDAQIVPLSKQVPVKISRNRLRNVRGPLDEYRNISGPDAECGFARRVSGSHKPDPARRQDHGSPLVLHQRLGRFDRAVFDAVDRIARQARSESLLHA